uniref:Uncharacterized protein n=1 Tax=Calcidiscus leptoporus TaxID=127549 RepID=A0A7S0NUC5_9EUKA|mmetsp:Transcript_25989/g.60664  ORF Transcript_25989/g.60664 Transcript_25989/m.60664 type:complete len:159 (+) Transcript_25989:174-650(+)
MVFLLTCLLASTTALLCPLAKDPLRLPSLPRRAASARLIGSPDVDPANKTPAPAPAAWPEPAFTVSELQAARAAADEAAEAEALAAPKPFIVEGGDFSAVALVTVLVFVAGGSLFFGGITGGGAARFADDQPLAVTECIKQATTRSGASACLPPVPLT